MWKALAKLNGEEVVIGAAGRYTDALAAARRWLVEQGDIWFPELLGKNPEDLPTWEIEKLGVEFVEEDEE